MTIIDYTAHQLPENLQLICLIWLLVLRFIRESQSSEDIDGGVGLKADQYLVVSNSCCSGDLILHQKVSDLWH